VAIRPALASGPPFTRTPELTPYYSTNGMGVLYPNAIIRVLMERIKGKKYYPSYRISPGIWINPIDYESWNIWKTTIPYELWSLGEVWKVWNAGGSMESAYDLRNLESVETLESLEVE
jgi:hypothetical protein